jgi:hypothetical protein
LYDALASSSASTETTNLSRKALDAKKQCLTCAPKGASGQVLFFAPLGRGLWSGLGFDALFFAPFATALTQRFQQWLGRILGSGSKMNSAGKRGGGYSGHS